MGFGGCCAQFDVAHRRRDTCVGTRKIGRSGTCGKRSIPLSSPQRRQGVTQCADAFSVAYSVARKKCRLSSEMRSEGSLLRFTAAEG